MTVPAENPLTEFQWAMQPQAQRVVRDIVEEFLKRCPPAVQLAQRMKEETGTRFIDWIGHITLAPDDPYLERARAAGYRKVEDLPVYEHRGGIFPMLVMYDDARAGDVDVAVKVESVADFCSANRLEVEIYGKPLDDVRVAIIGRGDRTQLAVIERHGNRYDSPGHVPAGVAEKRLIHLERFRMRQREFPDDVEGFAHTLRLIDSAIADLGVNRTCDLFFAAEREYWQRRNHAAQVQKSRQDRLGLGWGNHDHHTYRSSREYFAQLVAVWEKLGFHCRERFYAGREAGWGAQVMEQPTTGIVTFNDVDLSSEELMGDFSHDGLAPRQKLGTVGLWCALHGEALLQAGMHHLEAQFDFNSLRAQLESAGVKMMKPFTNFPHLTQAFTEGERWPVRLERIERLLSKGQITQQQAEEFRKNGAIGSHLENLERNDGFKGFNQTGVSEIIAATDPRRHVALKG